MGIFFLRNLLKPLILRALSARKIKGFKEIGEHVEPPKSLNFPKFSTEWE